MISLSEVIMYAPIHTILALSVSTLILMTFLIFQMICQMNELKSKIANEKQAMQKEISELKTKLIDSSIINNGQLSEMKKDIEELTQVRIRHCFFL